MHVSLEPACCSLRFPVRASCSPTPVTGAKDVWVSLYCALASLHLGCALCLPSHFSLVGTTRHKTVFFLLP